MSWSTDDGKHEAWLATTFGDGRLGSGSSGDGVTVSRDRHGQLLDYDNWQTRPPSEVTGWVTVCECGWRGQPWTRVGEPTREDLAARKLFIEDADVCYVDEERVEAETYREWTEHIAPVIALAEIEELARERAELDRRMDAAIAKARSAGASSAAVEWAKR